MKISNVYKLFHLRRDGSLGPLFINRKLRIPLGKWMGAEVHPTPGYTYRPGWHCMITPEAPHLRQGGDRVWARCQVRNYTEYSRPKTQGGWWVLAEWLKVVEVL